MNTVCLHSSYRVWWGIIFGGLVVYLCNHQIKIRYYFLLAYIIHVVIPYQPAKLKSANIFAMGILGPTTKFNSRQYFWLYCIIPSPLYIRRKRKLGAEHETNHYIATVLVANLKASNGA